MIKHTRRNRRSAFAGFFTSNTMVGVQSSVLANVSAGNRSAHVLRMQPETLLLEDRVMPVVNLSVSDLTIVEGDAGTKDALFTVTRSGDSNAAFTVDYQTEDGTAKAGQDYLGNSGTLTFLAGENLKQVSVAVIGNNVLQVDRAFSLKILNPKQLQSPDIQFGTGAFTQTFPVAIGLVRAADLNGDQKTDTVFQLYQFQGDSDSIGYLTQGFDGNKAYERIDLANLKDNNDDNLVRAQVNSLHLADFNADGANDIIVGSNFGVILLKNNGSISSPGNPNNRPFSDLKSEYQTDFSMGSVSQVISVPKVDSRVDLVGCNDNGIFLMQNSTDGQSFLPAKFIDNIRTQNIISGDFNGDFINDLIAVQGDKLLQLAGNTDGSFTRSYSTQLPSY